MTSLHVNIWAVLAATLATMAVGMLWYSPLLFARAWMKAHGYTPEKLAGMKKSMGRAYAVSFACYLVMAAALALLVQMTGSQSMLDGAKLGLVCWIGFAATIGLTANMFSDKPLATYLIDVGYQLVYIIVMGAILAAWQ